MMNSATIVAGSAAADSDAALSDQRFVLQRLSVLGDRVAALRAHLAASLSSPSVPGVSSPAMSDLHAVSSEIASAAQQLILLGASLLTTPLIPPPPPTPIPPPQPPSIPIPPRQPDPNPTTAASTTTTSGSREPSDFDLVEIDAAELLAEHVHFCEICGKGFRRDANLRMHMRAHGDRFKTLESLSHPSNRNNSGDVKAVTARPVRFSCPFNGCNRNSQHRRFRPLKSAVCARNHFRRSHCPKLYACQRCGKKSFSVLADLRSHLKNCGSAPWKCSCGTTFSRKDKLFGHLALFQGHMPAIAEEEEKGIGKVEVMDGDEVMAGNGEGNGVGNGDEAFDEEFFDDWMMELGGGPSVGGWSGSAFAPSGR